MKWRSLDESGPSTETRPLRQVFAERKQLIAQYVPADVLAVHARVIRELKSGGMADRVLAPGTSAPSFDLSDHNRKPVSSAALLAKGPIVACFFRGRWDPFCCGQLEAMNAIEPQLAGAGASLLAISPQTVQQSFFMADQHRLRFPVLSDPGNRIARQFGLVYRVPEDQQSIYRRAMINLPFVNGDDSWELPVPGTFIIGPGGVVLHAWSDPDYTERPEPVEVLSRLRGSAPQRTA